MITFSDEKRLNPAVSCGGSYISIIYLLNNLFTAIFAATIFLISLNNKA
jgi:hypothetical protein